MSPDRAAAVDQAFIEGVRSLPAGPTRDRDAPVGPGTSLTGKVALEIFDAQMKSRHLDLAARWLRSRDQGYYTIGSSGHEGNAAVAEALCVTDPALLFQIKRRPALGPRLQESDQAAALRQLGQQRVRLGLDRAVDEDHVVGAAILEAFDQRALRDRLAGRRTICSVAPCTISPPAVANPNAAKSDMRGRAAPAMMKNIAKA